MNDTPLPNPTPPPRESKPPTKRERLLEMLTVGVTRAEAMAAIGFSDTGLNNALGRLRADGWQIDYDRTSKVYRTAERPRKPKPPKERFPKKVKLGPYKIAMTEASFLDHRLNQVVVLLAVLATSDEWQNESEVLERCRSAVDDTKKYLIRAVLDERDE